MRSTLRLAALLLMLGLLVAPLGAQNLSTTVQKVVNTDATGATIAATVDPDDASIAVGQTNGNVNALTMAYDGSVWRRLTFGTAGTASAQVLTVQGIASMTPFLSSQSGTWTIQPGNTANTTAWLFAGGKTNNNAAPGATNFGAISFIANAAAQTWTEGNLVLGSVDLHGSQRILTMDSSGAAVTFSTDATTNTTTQTTGPQGFCNASAATPTAVGADGRSIATWCDTNGMLYSNLFKVNGTTIDTNSGNKSAGTIRVVLATDQPALTNKLLVTPDSVALPANQSVNIAQFGGTNVSTGTGAGGAGIPRVTLSNDSALAANQSVNLSQVGSSALALGRQFATQAIPTVTAYDDPILTALAQLTSAVKTQSALTARTGTGFPAYVNANVVSQNVLDPCSDPRLVKNIAISQTANTVLLAAQPGGRMLICTIFVVGADAENLSLVEGTGTTCGTNTAAIIGGTTAANGPNFGANAGWVETNGGHLVALQNNFGTDLCLLQSGSGRVSGNATIALLR